MVHRGVRHLRESLAQVVGVEQPWRLSARSAVAPIENVGSFPWRPPADRHAQVLARMAVQDQRVTSSSDRGDSTRGISGAERSVLLRPGGPRRFLRHGVDRVVVQPAVPWIDHDNLARPELAASHVPRAS
jgi:hypothetical protein